MFSALTSGLPQPGAAAVQVRASATTIE